MKSKIGMKMKSNVKKLPAAILASSLLLAALTGCGAAEGAGSENPDGAALGATDAKIVVVSREEGSGTRSAFVELFGVHDDANPDLTAPTAEITNNTAVMMTSVEGNRHAIGYVSLGSLNDTVKALRIDGVEPTAENVANGSYAISRPFNIATKGEISPSAQDFLNFIMSSDGQDVIEGSGYIRVADSGPYAGGNPTEKVVVAGSSSVTPAMEALSEAYAKLQPGADIEIQQSDSSTGMNSAIDGICDIGMASRALKDSETEKGLVGTTIAMDGIAVIVNKENAAGDMTRDQVKSIFMGETVNWQGL